MRTARALERHLEEDIVARHCVTIPRAPSVASGRALNAPHTRAKWSRARAKWSLVCSVKVLVGCKSRSTLFKSGAYGQKDTGLDEPLKFVTTFPYRSEETEARRVPLCTPCASGYPRVIRRRFGQPRVPHARVVSSRGATGAPRTTSPNPPPGEHVTSRWQLLGTPPTQEEPLPGSPWWAPGSPGSPPRRALRAGGAR